MTDDRPPFRHAVEALLYLFNPERATCDRPPAARMADKRRGDPGALAGLDGAAEIGTAEAMLRARLTLLQLCVLASRYAPPALRPSAKDDKAPRANQQWRAAIIEVAQQGMAQAIATCRDPNYRFIVSVLRREFGKEKIRVTTVGSQEGLSLGTCSRHKKLVLDWAWRQERDAFAEAESVLRGGGFIP